MTIFMDKKFLIFGSCLCMAVSMNAAKYTFNITQPVKDAKLTITLNADGTEKNIALVNGKGSTVISGFKPQYATITYGQNTRTLYLEPNKDLAISFDGKTFNKTITFTGKETAVNNYLNHTDFATLKFEDCSKPEAVYLKSTDSVYTANINRLQNAKLPADFKQKEMIRLKYLSYETLPWYKTYYQYLNKVKDFQTSPAYQQKIDSLAEINPDYLVYPEYKSFISYAIMGIAYREYPNIDQNQAFMKYVPANVKDQKVLDYVTNKYIYDQISLYGLTAGSDSLVDFYHNTVKDPVMTKRFDGMLAQWKALEPGQPSATFSLPDINGKTVALSDLKGKYVYIDVWATWCGPCRAELPHLKKLEEAYSGKGIAFVSISCDQNKTAWKNMVTNGQMKGIQLYMGNKNDFMKKYMINGIPRFILLDKEGKIINANAPRPSDPSTSKLFDKLLSEK